MLHLPGICRTGGVLLVSLLSACGGGDDKEFASTSLSSHSISFSAAAPDASTPAAQTITATFGSSIAHLAVVHGGPAVARVRSTLSGQTAQITIEPHAPSSIGAGLFNGTVAVTGYVCADAACGSLVAGNTETVAVNYQVSPVVQLVAPYVAMADTSATAIIRGIGFKKFAVSGVSFGATAATSFTLVSDTEIRATYPALAAGDYPVSIDIPTHQGAVPSSATLVAVDSFVYPAELLSYPVANPAIRALVYDAERRALLLATDTNGGTLIRFAHVGGAWSPAASVAVSELQDIALSTGGTQLLALSRTGLRPVEPETLAPGAAIPAPSLETGNFLKNIAVANNDIAVITTGIDKNEATSLYLFDVRGSILDDIDTSMNNARPGSSADGSRMALVQGHPDLTTDPSVFTYTASSNAFASSGVALNQASIAPVLDRGATRIVLNGVKVYDVDFDLLGTLPSTTDAVALSPDGKRAYTFDADAVLTFDISKDADGKAFAQVGSALALAGDPGAEAQMAISPDGKTLFLAGSTQLVIQPTP